MSGAGSQEITFVAKNMKLRDLEMGEAMNSQNLPLYLHEHRDQVVRTLSRPEYCLNTSKSLHLFCQVPKGRPVQVPEC